MSGSAGNGGGASGASPGGRGGAAGAGASGKAGSSGSSGGASGAAQGGTSGNAGAAGTSGKAGTAGSAGSTAGNAGQGGGGGGTASGGAAGSVSAGTSGDGGTSASGGAAGSSGAGGVAGSSGAGGSGGAPHTGPWRIMPLGDSITGTTCYPQLLSQKLKDAGRTNFTFLGTNLNNQSCAGAPNVMTEGHGGYILSCLTGDFSNNCAGKGMPSELASWMNVSPPLDVALILFGTNDVWNSIATETITSAFTHLTEDIREANPNAVIFIGQILPMHPDGCVDSDANCVNNRVKALNAAIPGWAASQATTASPIHVVDIYASIGDADAFTTNSALTSDGVHPNATGAGMMADAWLNALTSRNIP
jgi:lysophospholipase L1-like esterase